ncbi:hypothetical protein D5F01_LYC25348 [Larimichthys crocea]|uniref:Uncharacterized protein n=1 Tax=Larimichthys crocea TaxID=215358 RepID=A0A644EWN4_LARCR|nr:hypothetical protein D5F01_LYC25348 [Larimichthys crocea]
MMLIMESSDSVNEGVEVEVEEVVEELVEVEVEVEVEVVEVVEVLWGAQDKEAKRLQPGAGRGGGWTWSPARFNQAPKKGKNKRGSTGAEVSASFSSQEEHLNASSLPEARRCVQGSFHVRPSASVWRESILFWFAAEGGAQRANAQSAGNLDTRVSGRTGSVSGSELKF